MTRPAFARLGAGTPPRMPKCVVADPAFDVGLRSRCRVRDCARHRSSTRCTSRGFTMQPRRTSPPSCAARTPAVRARRRSDHLSRAWASRPSSFCRCISTCRDEFPAAARAGPTTGATTPSATSRRTPPTPPRCAPGAWGPGGQVNEFKAMVRRCTRRAGGHPGRGATTPPRAARPAPRCATVAWTTRVRPVEPGTPRPVLRHHRDRGLAERREPGGAARSWTRGGTWVTETHVDGSGSTWPPPWRVRRASQTRCPRSRPGGEDPVVSQAKLIAEPWTSGRWTATTSASSRAVARVERQYRDSMRDFWRSQKIGRASSPPGSLARTT